MNRLESNRYFKPTGNIPRELERPRPNGVRVRLDGDGSEWSSEPGDSQHIL
jgi:hypothetical protein